MIDDLEVNITNYKRIKDYMVIYHSYSAFNHLILDFQMFLTKRELLHLIDHGTIYTGLIELNIGNRLKNSPQAFRAG